MNNIEAQAELWVVCMDMKVGDERSKPLLSSRIDLQNMIQLEVNLKLLENTYQTSHPTTVQGCQFTTDFRVVCSGAPRH